MIVRQLPRDFVASLTIKFFACTIKAACPVLAGKAAFGCG